MLFISSEDCVNHVAELIANSLHQELTQAKKVLLLLAGGSALELYEKLVSQLDLESYHNLSISLGDERYVEDLNSYDSNWAKLKQTNFYQVLLQKQANFIPVLQGEDYENSTDKFSKFLTKWINSEDHIISIQGIGNDGHTLGILPLDNKQMFMDLFVNTNRPVTAHEIDKQFNRRITANANLIKRCDQLICYAVGESKQQVLKLLREYDQLYPNSLWEDKVHSYPALLNSLNKTTTIFTDQEV